MKVYVITGAPGAGKGTIAELIEKEMKLVHISTGDMLRHHVEKGDEIGLRVQDYIDNGKLVPDSLIEEMIHLRLSKQDVKDKGALLDGFPRTLEQAKDLIKTIKVDSIIEVFLEDENIIQRLSKRRVCPSCGASYHLESKKPEKENVCDVCSSELIHREDDTPDVIKDRLNVYHTKTQIILDFFKEKGVQVLQLRGDLDLNTQKEFILNQVENLK